MTSPLINAMSQTKLVKEANELRGTNVQLVDCIIKSQTLISFGFSFLESMMNTLELG